MDISEQELEELKSIHDYLNSRDPKIRSLGFSLYMINYANKLDTYIKNPRKSEIFSNREQVYICDYMPYECYRLNLGYAIYLLCKHNNYDIFEE